MVSVSIDCATMSPIPKKRPPMKKSIFATYERRLTASEVAARLGVTPWTVYHWAATGRLPCIRMSRKALRFFPLTLINLNGFAPPPPVNPADIPERVWALMSQADREAFELGRVSAAEALGKYVRRRETQEQRILTAWLNIKINERKLYWIHSRSDKPSTIRKGHPDFTVWLPGGRVLFQEMKVDGGVLSPEQVQSIELLAELGYQVELPHSASEAISQVKKYL